MLPVDTATCRSRDVLSNRRLTAALFWLPAIAMIVAGTSLFGDAARTAVWTVALGTMGAACVVNAARCGRIHCYLTGPFFLLMAAATALFGLHLLPLSGNGWTVISLTTLIGAAVLCCVPELIFGKYRKRVAAPREPAAKD